MRVFAINASSGNAMCFDRSVGAMREAPAVAWVGCFCRDTYPLRCGDCAQPHHHHQPPSTSLDTHTHTLILLWSDAHIHTPCPNLYWNGAWWLCVRVEICGDKYYIYKCIPHYICAVFKHSFVSGNVHTKDSLLLFSTQTHTHKYTHIRSKSHYL